MVRYNKPVPPTKSKKKKSKGIRKGKFGSLTARGKQLSSENKAHAKEQAKITRHEEHLKANRRKKQRKTAKLPFNRSDRILLIGEGNFSFATALAGLLDKAYAPVGSEPGTLVATCYDGEAVLREKYEEAAGAVAALREGGTSVLCGVDGTDLVSNPALLESLDRTATGEPLVNKVVFNFPHTGCGIQDTKANVAVHRDFLYAFFQSAADLLDRVPENKAVAREIHVTIKKGEPYQSWGIAGLARKTGRLKLKTAVEFFPDMYPGYEHRRTIGAAGEEEKELYPDTTLTLGANEDIQKLGARTYIFEMVGANEEADEGKLHSDVDSD